MLTRRTTRHKAWRRSNSISCADVEYFAELWRGVNRSFSTALKCQIDIQDLQEPACSICVMLSKSLAPIVDEPVVEMMVQKAAHEATGLSGRSLRRLPLHAHASLRAMRKNVNTSAFLHVFTTVPLETSRSNIVVVALNGIFRKPNVSICALAIT